MLKNKKLGIVLIPVVILVWGYFAYLLFYDANPKINQTVLEGNKLNLNFTSSLTDTFIIAVNYRDPFLGKTNIPVVKPTNRKPATPKPVLQWPQVQYSGMIKNQDNKKLVALVKINGKTNMMKEGDVVLGITLQKINKDSVVVQFQKEKKYIKK